MTEGQRVVIHAVAGAITGVVAGLLFLSWSTDIGAKLVLMAGLLLILVVRRERRLVNAAGFLTAAGVVSLGGQLLVENGADAPFLLVAAGLLVAGIAFGALVVAGLRGAAGEAR
jgi:hypothetical protein